MYANRGLVDEWLPLMDKRGRRRRGEIHIQVNYQADPSYAANFAATSAPLQRSASSNAAYVAPVLSEEECMRQDPLFAFNRRMRMMRNPEEFQRPDLPGSQAQLDSLSWGPQMPSLRELIGGLSGRSRPPSGGQPLGVANPNYDPYPDFQPHPLSDITRREITPEDYDLLLSLDDNNPPRSSSSTSSTPTASTSSNPVTYSSVPSTSVTRVSTPPAATSTTNYSSYSTSPATTSSYPSSSSSYSTYNRAQNPMTYSTTPVQSSAQASSSPATPASSASAPPAAPNQCKVCYDHNVDCVLIPCGHAGMCFDCANIQKNTNGSCPFCRAPISNVVKQFPV